MDLKEPRKLRRAIHLGNFNLLYLPELVIQFSFAITTAWIGHPVFCNHNSLDWSSSFLLQSQQPGSVIQSSLAITTAWIGHSVFFCNHNGLDLSSSLLLQSQQPDELSNSPVCRVTMCELASASPARGRFAGRRQDGASTWPQCASSPWTGPCCPRTFSAPARGSLSALVRAVPDLPEPRYKGADRCP